jgi:hypothetical protein
MGQNVRPAHPGRDIPDARPTDAATVGTCQATRQTGRPTTTPINQPAPLSLHVQQAIAYAVHRMSAAIRNNRYALKDREAEIGNEMPKQALPELRRLAADARERMLVAVRTWGELRRFGHKNAQAATDNVIQARFGATGDALAAAEFYRRVMFNATADSFGNWTTPE